MDEEARTELLRLVELEYDRTGQFIEGTVAVGTAVRGWAITVWLAILGVALGQKLWQVALLGIVAPAVFMAVDGYHGALYSQALDHAKDLERITGGQYARLSRGKAHRYADVNAQVLLASHKYGLYSNLREFRWKDFRRARPRVFFRVFYPTMAGIAAVASVGLAVLLPRH